MAASRIFRHSQLFLFPASSYRRAALCSPVCFRSRPSSSAASETEQENGKHQNSEGRKRALYLSIATGSAVAALGAAYILYNNNYKLKAQEQGVGEVLPGGGQEGESPGKGAESKERTSFRDQRIIAYEDRIRAYSTPDKVFRLFATLKVTSGDSGGIYMTPEDFVRSITPGVKQPEGLGLDEFRKLDEEGLKEWRSVYLREKAASSDEPSFFDKLGECGGILSFTDYLFLLTVLATPKRHFKLAFKMFDIDGDGVLSRKEFEEVHSIIKKGTSVGARHRDHASTGSVAMGVSNAVTTYLFGTDGSKQLSYQEFQEFQSQLTEACLRIEFNRFQPDESNRISELQFARLILSHAEFENQEEKRYLKRLKQGLEEQDRRGVTFHQVQQFSVVLDNIGDLDKAMGLYEAGKKDLIQAEFKHLVKTVTGVDLDDHIIKVIFTLFDENNDGELSNKEFVAVMRKRKTLGLGKSKELGFMKLFSAVLGCGHSVLNDLVATKAAAAK